MTDLLEVDDLTPFATIDEDKAAEMIVDAVAQATLAAPCLADPDALSPLQRAQAKSILRGAILRWHDAGSGAVATQTAGPFGVSMDTRQVRRAMYWPSEITDLQKVCSSGASSGGAFSIDTAATPMAFHSSLCGWAGAGCTCGAIAFDSGTYY